MKQSSKRSDILVVEDEIPTGEALKEMLELYGYHVSIVTSGREALDKVYSEIENIRIILMDIKMPGEIDGIDATREILQKYPQIPVILVTAHEDNIVYQQRVKEANLKIVGWIDKPITGDNEKKLMKMIENELKRAD